MRVVLLVILLFYYTVNVCAIKGLLSRQRIYSEFRDIADQLLTLDIPFNTSSDECGIRLSPMKNNMLDWHFSFTGVEGSQYEGGIYHGIISLSSQYPRKAPIIKMKTPSGRWRVNEEICLSASAHHPELWDPSWNLRTLVLSLRNFMTTQPNEIGGMRATAGEKQIFMEKSKGYVCPTCQVNHQYLLPKLDEENLLGSGLSVVQPPRLLHSRARLVDASMMKPLLIAQKNKANSGIESKKSANRPFRSLQGKHKVTNLHQFLRICVVLFGSLLVRHIVDAIIKYVNDVLI